MHTHLFDLIFEVVMHLVPDAATSTKMEVPIVGTNGTSRPLHMWVSLLVSYGGEWLFYRHKMKHMLEGVGTVKVLPPYPYYKVHWWQKSCTSKCCITSLCKEDKSVTIFGTYEHIPAGPQHSLLITIFKNGVTLWNLFTFNLVME